MELIQLNNIIKSSKNILLTSHVNPDGDTLGSMCGLYSLIELNFKKHCDMLVVSKISGMYKHIPNIKLVKQLNEIDKSREYDLVINLDVASLDRICDAKILFEKAKTTVNIDHHETNIGYANLNYIEPQASSTAEVIFGISKALNWKMNLDVANSLYVGILTDTGSFRFDNTTAKTLRYASDMLKMGVKPSEHYRNVYESIPKNMVMFQTYCVNKAKFLNNDKIVYTTVYKKDMEKFSAEEDYTEGLTEKLRAIISTEIAFVAKEMNNGWTKISMRSKSQDVASICKKFDGGGHKLAAGCTIKSSIDESIQKILDTIQQK